jgi:hypothetical protein
VLSLAAVVLLTGCTREAPSMDLAPPDVAPSPAPARGSRLSVPLQYDFTSVLQLVDSIVPRKFGSMAEVKQMGDNDHRHYAFEAMRGPFSAFADGNLLHLRATLTYQARGYLKPALGPTFSAGCGGGNDGPRLVVELATPLSLTDNWHLASRARVVSVEPASTAARDHCDVSILHKDVTPQVVDAARAGLTDKLPMIDRKIAGVDLTAHVAEWWGMLLKPIQLAPEVWLVLSPKRLSIGRMQGHSKILTVPISLEANPTIVTGRTAPVIPVTAIPPLGRDSASDGYHIVMDGVIDYGTASRELTAALSARTFSQSGHTVSISSVSIIPQPKGRLGVSAVFAGDAKGTVHLIGAPRIDHAHEQIAVPDLDFDVQTGDALLKSYAWLKSDALRKELRARARISTAPALARGRSLLLEGLNRKIGSALTLSATVDSVAVLGLFVTRDGLVVRAEAHGRAFVSVKQ